MRHRSTLVLAAALVPGLAVTARPVHAQVDDPTIVAIFDAANTWDIETGQLAEKNGTTKDVRDFGAMLVRDHKTVRQQGRDLAKKLHVTPTPPKDFALAKDHAEAMTKLARPARQGVRPGVSRERGRVPQGRDRRHDDARCSRRRRTPRLKDLEKKVAPAFAAHRDAAKNLLTKS